jgi:hypothetical protein
MTLEERFNRSGFSRFINSRAGRVFRLTAGSAFLIAGFLYRDHTLGIVSMVFSILPLTAGGFDLCYISAVLGGPLRGSEIRARQHPR